MAALYAAQNDDTRFFISLLGLNFPLYHEDNDHNFPAFYIANVKTDSKFCSSFNALLEAKFDLTHENTEDETFLTKVCKSPQVSVDKIQGIIQTKPIITEQMMQELEAKVFASKASSKKSTKYALRTLKEYAITNFPDIDSANACMFVYCC